MIHNLVSGKLPQKLKRSVNMATLGNEWLIQQIFAHFERDFELNVFEESGDFPMATKISSFSEIGYWPISSATIARKKTFGQRLCKTQQEERESGQKRQTNSEENLL